MSDTVAQLFTEKFRPKELSSLIVPERIKNELSRGLVQNLLLFGNAGSGKTSSLFILSKPYTTLYINASSERGIDVLRDKIGKFCATISLENGKEKLKCVILDECLYEEEKVRIGTIDNFNSVKLKDLNSDEIYSCVSMNIDTGLLENDTCEIISEKADIVYEIELEDGRKINATANHPFMIIDSDGNITQKTINEGLNLMDDVIVF